jgi:proteasome accessory factor A
VAFDGGPLLRLAQRPPFVRTLARIFPTGGDRPMFETRDLFFRPWSALLSRRRLHLLVGDANLCEWAQVLRIGTTALILEVIESSPEVRLPALADPLDALRATSLDPDLRAPLATADGGIATALEIQRRYLRAVREALGPTGGVEPWKARVLRAWEETLDLLERNPAALADRVDWIAKRELLGEEVPDPADRAALARRGAALVRDGGALATEDRRLRGLAFRVWRMDLRYHELGPRGGHRRLERRGRVRRLSDHAAVERARTEPPPDTRAWARGQAIKVACAHARGGGVAWHRVRLGKLEWRWLRDPLDPGRMARRDSNS